MTRPRRCAQFAFQMRREERERAPLGVMLYIWTRILMCVRGRREALFSRLSDVCGQSLSRPTKCSLTDDVLHGYLCCCS